MKVIMDSAKDVKKYVETCREIFWQNVFQFETKYLVSHLEGYRDILSVGCGPAIIEGKLSEHGFNITGLDISVEAIKCAPDTVRAFAGRAEDMPFAESSFDVVTFVASLQFIEDYRKALQQSFTVLRPEGKIIVMLLNPKSEFFKERLLEPDSYVNLIKHTDLNEIADVIQKSFIVQTEYILGVKGENIFESKSPDEAALYVVFGKKK